MANVVADPREHPQEVLPDFSKADPALTFKLDDVSLVYGSKWKQRYFKKVGNDPGSEHVRQPTAQNIVNPAKLDFVRANDTCIQCHSQGQPFTNPMGGQYYDWPVGFHQGGKLRDYRELDTPKLWRDELPLFRGART